MFKLRRLAPRGFRSLVRPRLGKCWRSVFLLAVVRAKWLGDKWFLLSGLLAVVRFSPDRGRPVLAVCLIFLVVWSCV